MKLGYSACYTCTGSYYISSSLVNEQQNWRDERWQAFGQLGGTLGRYKPRAGRVQHKADGIGSGRNGCVYVLLAGQTANFDTGALGKKFRCHGNQS